MEIRKRLKQRCSLITHKIAKLLSDNFLDQRLSHKRPRFSHKIRLAFVWEELSTHEKEFFALLNGTKPFTRPIKAGVFQGLPRLPQTLYNLLMLSPPTKIVLFAEDTCIYYSNLLQGHLDNFQVFIFYCILAG